MSTTINPGLEIWHLSFKDDSFRMSEWYDNIVGNQITFYNGTVKTTGITGDFSINPLNLPSLVLTNGDEVTLPAFSDIKKTFGTEYTIIPVPYRAIQSIRLRAKNLGSIGTLTVILLDQTFVPIVGGSVTVTLSSSLYTHYTVPISLSQGVAGIELVNTVDCMVDYVAFATSDYLNQGGDSLNVTIPKKTASQAIPNSSDVIQQIGIGSRSKAVDIPKVSTAAYRWLEDKLVNSVPIELITPTEQATGYLSDISRHSEAGWVGTPLLTADAMSTNPAVAQQLYDLSVSLTKADNEQNIYTVIPPVPPPTISVVATSSIIDEFEGVCSFFAAGLYWIFYTRATLYSALYYKTAVPAPTLLWSTEQVGTSSTFLAGEYTVQFDGTYLYYITETGKFRRGIPQANGSIIWSTIEQTATATGIIAIDSTNHPWIAGYNNISTSSTTDGTWVTGAGWPVNIYPASSIVSLTSGKMAITGLSSVVAWNGSSFNIAASFPITLESIFWTIGVGDDVYILAARHSNSNTVLFHYTYSTNTIVLLTPDIFSFYPSGVANDCSMGYDAASNKLYILADHETSPLSDSSMVYSVYDISGESLSGPFTIDTIGVGETEFANTSTFYYSQNNIIGFQYNVYTSALSSYIKFSWANV